MRVSGHYGMLMVLCFELEALQHTSLRASQILYGGLFMRMFPLVVCSSSIR